MKLNISVFFQINQNLCRQTPEETRYDEAEFYRRKKETKRDRHQLIEKAVGSSLAKGI